MALGTVEHDQSSLSDRERKLLYAKKAIMSALQKDGYNANQALEVVNAFQQAIRHEKFGYNDTGWLEKAVEDEKRKLDFYSNTQSVSFIPGENRIYIGGANHAERVNG